MGKNYIPSKKQQDKIREDIIGMRFGRLTVQSYSHSQKSEKWAGYKHYYNCICDCGNTYIGERNSLKSGNTQSCGCIRSEMLIKRNKDTGILHGDSKKYRWLYGIWIAMKSRCENPLNKCYSFYGGNGIQVCPQWHDWEQFKQWALNNGYQDNLTIDRIDFSGNYEPSNCRWADCQTQANNKRNNKYITYQGRTQSLSDWCRELGLNYDRTKQRINACSMTPDEAFNLPKYFTQKECDNKVSKRKQQTF